MWMFSQALTGTLRHSVEQMHAGIKQWTMLSNAVQVVFDGVELIKCQSHEILDNQHVC